MATDGTGPTASGGRVAWIDLARGGAVAAMVVYHFFWDTNYFGFTDVALFTDPLWLGFRAAILSAFLLLAGFGLTLAHGAGFRRRPFFRRLGVIAAAAGAITAGSLAIFPESYIFFGVLHCIALGSVLALPFLRLPSLAVLLSAAGAFALPPVFANPAFDHPWLQWLGLVSVAPVTNDYVPLFPWFGVLLLGVAGGRYLTAIPGGRTPGPLKPLDWSGRHSLLVYLVHQPLLLGLMWIAAPGPDSVAQRDAFTAACLGNCEAGSAACTEYCACLLEDLRRSGRWEAVLAGTLPAETALEETSGACTVPPVP